MRSFSSGEDFSQWDAQGPSANEEKICVSVRLRPLNEREVSRNDLSVWECINKDTIIFKSSHAERPLFPTSYSFDRVFGSNCSTEEVYENGAKKVALSVVDGINSSVFAYGQTSSGKTYTMTGITEYTIADIYNYIHEHSERDFTLKFCAMEIYNEAVRDLLSSDTTPLRLLDDPERGTVVERLTEVTLRDLGHLTELLSACEDQRQIGETALNEMSSRSHQIIRLSVESSARGLIGGDSTTLSAIVNFIDLAGSERSSQTQSAGARLKEGCHINRSLLTLGTVIRKLSSKGRNGHVPYRDSKLTRILQNSLGGNARTAIICTVSPAQSHVEQSRNTLVFASCAKEVSTNAQVNVVMSEKALVRKLQKELARLESELLGLSSISRSGDSASALAEKELLIQKMSKEIKKVTDQRDFAQARIEDLLRGGGGGGEHHASRSWDKRSWTDEYSASESSEVVDSLRLDAASPSSYLSDRYDTVKSDQILPEDVEDQFLSGGTSPRIVINKYFGPDPCEGWEKTAHHKTFSVDSEDHFRDVQCVKMEPRMNRNMSHDVILIATPSSPEKENRNLEEVPMGGSNKYPALKLEPSPWSSDTDLSCCRLLDQVARSKSCRAILMTTTPLPPPYVRAEEIEDTLSCGTEEEVSIAESPEEVHRLKPSHSEPCPVVANSKTPCRKDYGKNSTRLISMDGQESLDMLSEDGRSIRDSCVAEDNDDVMKSENQKEKQIADGTSQAQESGLIAEDDGSNSDNKTATVHSSSNWPSEFEMQRKQIIELWDSCCVPLVHRTYFYMLFKGDPSDSVYMEVELRRLSFLKQTLSIGPKIVTPASSVRALSHERKMLSKQLAKKFTEKEREALYQKWGIKLDTKRRKQQMLRRIWTDTEDMNHIEESAALIAKLIDLAETRQVPKEMFGLSFSPRPVNFKSFSYKPTVSSFM